MKLILTLLFLTSGSFTWAVQPLSKNDLAPFEKNLLAQTRLLESQSPQTCEASYRHIFAPDLAEVHISMVYGYLDSQDVAMDGAFSRTMIDHLQLPCQTPQVQACGFRLARTSGPTTELRKQIKIGQAERTIVLTVLSPSLTWDDRYNQGLQQGYWDQKKQSEAVQKEFLRALKESQVVLYDGHARRGAGPGFFPTDPIREYLSKIRRQSFHQVLDAVSDSRSQLKFLGLLACETEKYYEDEILSAAPHLGLIVTKANINADRSEQSLLGALNSLLARKCQPEFARSLIPEIEPKDQSIVVKNFFEYSRSDSPQVAGQGVSRLGTR